MLIVYQRRDGHTVQTVTWYLVGAVLHHPCAPSGLRAPSPAVDVLLQKPSAEERSFAQIPTFLLRVTYIQWLSIEAQLLAPIWDNSEGPALLQNLLGQPRPFVRLYRRSECLPCPVLFLFLLHGYWSWECSPINFPHLMFTSESASQGTWPASILQGVWDLRLQTGGENSSLCLLFNWI